MNCTSDFIFGTGISRVVRRKKVKQLVLNRMEKSCIRAQKHSSYSCLPEHGQFHFWPVKFIVLTDIVRTIQLQLYKFC